MKTNRVEAMLAQYRKAWVYFITINSLGSSYTPLIGVL